MTKEFVINSKNEIKHYFKKYGLGNTLKKGIKVLPLKLKEAINSYGAWRKNNEPNKKQLKKQKEIKFKLNPKISIIVSLDKMEHKKTIKMIKSIVVQTYSNWELCIIDVNLSPNKKIEKLVKRDKRIRYKKIHDNKGIAENLNEALKIANGEYIALLEQNDLLAPFALFEIAKCINNNPNVEFIYSDEDRISNITKKRTNPVFKPDFSIDTLRCNNYIGHLSVYKKELMDKLKGFNSEYDGMQDYELLLRMSENTNKICHIPQILYHCQNKPWSENEQMILNYGKKALQDHLDRIKIPATVKEGYSFGYYEIDYKIHGNPKVTILIPNKDEVDSISKCIDSILKLTTYSNYEVIIIENNSTTSNIFEYYETLKQYKNIKVIKYPDKGFNYSRIINYGVKNSTGEYILQLNNDTEIITPDWLEKMLQYIQREDVGVVGAKLYYFDTTIQHAGVIVGIGNLADHIYSGFPKKYAKAKELKNLSAVTGACLMSKRKIYEEVGYMNEELEVAFNDIDFCLKVREKGYLVVYNPLVQLFHYESKSRGVDDTEEKKKRFEKECAIFRDRWRKILKDGDPYYNINLTLNSKTGKISAKKINYDRG